MDSSRSESLITHRASRSSLWVIGGRFGNASLRFVANIVLARLLFPEAFGLGGLISALIMGLELFSDTGVGPSIVRSPRGQDRTFLGTAWTIQIVRGFVLFGVCLLLASPYSQLYQEPELRRLVPWAGFISICNGFRSVNYFLADRNLSQSRKVMSVLAAQACGVATMIVWAKAHPSVDALVGGNVVHAAALTVLSHLILPGPRPRLAWDRTYLSELYRFGRWILLSTALTFVTGQCDRLFLGFVLELAPLGIYVMATNMIDIVSGIQGQIASTILFPVWAATARSSTKEHLDGLKRARHLLDTVFIVALVALGTLAPTLFRLLYDERYQGVPALVQFLCLNAWLQILQSSASNAVLAFGDVRALPMAKMCDLIVRIPSAVGGFLLFGVQGFILGGAVGSLLGLAILHTMLLREGCNMISHDVRSTVRLLIALSAGVFLPRALGLNGALAKSSAEIATACTISLLSLWPVRRSVVRLLR